MFINNEKLIESQTLQDLFDTGMHCYKIFIKLENLLGIPPLTKHYCNFIYMTYILLFCTFQHVYNDLINLSSYTTTEFYAIFENTKRISTCAFQIIVFIFINLRHLFNFLSSFIGYVLKYIFNMNIIGANALDGYTDS